MYKIKLLGTIITNQLSWDENCSYLIGKVNSRMQLLRKCHSFGATPSEMVKLWITYCRNILEQSSVVWSSSLTQENITDLERTQKTFCKLVLQNRYDTYENSLLKLNLDSMQSRYEILNLRFAEQCIKNNKFPDLFPLNERSHQMSTRRQEKFKIFPANTQKLQNSSVIQMQYAINEKIRKDK